MQNPEIPEGLPDIQREAAEKFGITNNPFEAGFILSDGRLLKRPRGTTFHNYVEGEGSKPGDFAYNFLASGAIRFSRQLQRTMDIASAEFVQKPTERQILALKNSVQGVYSFSVDFTDLETRRPVIFEEKPVTLNTLLPTLGKLEEFFKKVTNATNPNEA